jgi:hypothetical protein
MVLIPMHFELNRLRTSLCVASLLMIVGLAGCGGNSSDSPAPTPTTLVVSPTSFSAFANTPNTVMITAGTGPFTVTSSDPNVLPVALAISGASFTFSANKVASNTPVTLTLKDSTGATATVAVTVTPATIIGVMSIAQAATSLCKNENNSAITAAALCAGETATASVTLRDNNGAAISGRAVKFEAQSAGATVAPGATNTSFGREATVTTDAAGIATVAVRADSTAPTEAVFLRATDTGSGHRVDTWITTLLQASGVTTLNTIPSNAGVNGYYSSECSQSSREYSVHGGQPPYALTLPAASALTLTGSAGAAAPGAGVTVTTAGGTFSVQQPANTTCASTSTIVTVTDALGKTVQPTFVFGPGSISKPAASTTLEFTPPSITFSAPFFSAYCTTSKARVVIRGGTAPYAVSTSIPQVTASLVDASTVEVGYVSDPKWKILKNQSARLLVQDATGKLAAATVSCI